MGGKSLHHRETVALVLADALSPDAQCSEDADPALVQPGDVRQAVVYSRDVHQVVGWLDARYPAGEC